MTKARGPQIVTVWISSNTAITTTPAGLGIACNPNILAVPELGIAPKSQTPCLSYKPNASIKALVNSGLVMRTTLASARERPMRLTLPYQPMR